MSSHLHIKKEIPSDPINRYVEEKTQVQHPFIIKTALGKLRIGWNFLNVIRIIYKNLNKHHTL